MPEDRSEKPRQGTLDLKDRPPKTIERYSVEQPVEIPPAAVDVLANLDTFRRNFELFAHRDSKLGRLENRNDRDKATNDVLLPMWGPLVEVDTKGYDPSLPFINKLTRKTYAFSEYHDLQMTNSAALEDYALRYSRGAILDNDLIVSDYALSGANESFVKANPKFVSENATIFNSACYGKEFGKYLKRGKFVKSIIGGVEVFLESSECSFQETYIVTHHGAYYLKDVTFEPGERFRLREEWKLPNLSPE